MSGNLRFDGKVAIVTGAGVGLGRVYALYLGKLGAKVVVNDLGVSVDGKATSVKVADLVVAEIKKAGGEAVANYDSVVDGEKLVKTAIDAFGRIDIIINNAGILRDVGFHRMSKKDFDIVHQVHVHGSKNVIQAAWPYFREQKYGRIVNVTSSNGLYGQRGQVNYSSAKAAIIGMTKALAKEGERRNIKVNVIGPAAGSRMTATILPENIVKLWKSDLVAPLVAFLAHESVPVTGKIFEAGGGWFAEVRYERSAGLFLNIDKPFGIDDIQSNWSTITNFENSVNPETDDSNPTLKQILAKL